MGSLAQRIPPGCPSLASMSFLRLALLPFSWLYGLVLRLRHAGYDLGWLRAKSADVPTITVGNIALGGTGKTPHVELVLRTLLDGQGSDPVPVLATLSRGYGRKGTGFAEVSMESDAASVGDEPLMLKRKFSGVHVFVGADRAQAVAGIRERVPQLRAVILDDALQHRAFRSSLNIVLTTWQRPWNEDHLLPAGNLRDLPYRARQAEVVMVTKCPERPSHQAREAWRRKLRLLPRQALFFSGLRYEAPRPLASTGDVHQGPDTAALLLTGVADPAPLAAHVRGLFGTVRHLAYSDHHAFSEKELEHVAAVFNSFATSRKTLITTEKDAARLGTAALNGPLRGIPVAVIGIRSIILDQPHEFEALIRSHVATHPAHR